MAKKSGCFCSLCEFIADLIARLIRKFRSKDEFEYSGPPRCGDIAHALVVMEELGRIHGLSKALMTKEIVLPADFPAYPWTEEYLYDVAIAPSVTKIGQIMKKHWGSKWNEVAKKLISCVDENKKATIAVVGTADKKFCVLNNGNVWEANMVFHYDNDSSSTPVSMKLQETRLSHIDSFAWDLTFFLYSSVEPELRRENFHLLLKTYSDSLKSALEKRDFLRHNIPTFDDVCSEVERIKAYRVATFCHFHIQRVYDLTLHKESGSCDKRSHSTQPQCILNKKVIARLGPDFKDFATNGIL